MTNRTTNIITILSTCTVALALAWFGIMSPLADLTLDRSARTDARALLEIQRQQTENLTSAKTVYEDLVKTKTELSTVFWERNKQLDFLTTLEKIATESGVQNDITISDIPTGTEPIEVPVTITVSGPWPSILVQLRALEHLRPIVLVESVDVTGINATTVTATLTAKSLWL